MVWAVTKKEEHEVNELKTIEVVAAVILNSSGKVFATQRGYGEFEGGWEFPGGKVEPGETHHEALIREIKEELGVNINIGKSIGTIEFDYPTFRLVMHCYFCNISSGDILLNEHKAAKWLGKIDLRSVNWLLADVGLIGTIEDLL
jgi:8-oxo-dGTP diphosphatase